MTTEELAVGDPTTWLDAVEWVLDPLLRAQSLLPLVSSTETSDSSPPPGGLERHVGPGGARLVGAP